MAELANPLRIVCTKCVQIVRVHFQDVEFAYDSTVVATECCERHFGFIDCKRIAMSRRGERDLTTGDIKGTNEVDQFIEHCDHQAERNRARSEWARWSKADR